MAAAQIDTLQKFGQSFQNKTLNILLHDLGVLNTLNELIHPKFFEAESSKWIVQTTLDYYSLFKKQPTMDVFKVELEKIQSKALKKSVIEQLKIIYVELEKNDTEYIKREFTNFCINQNLKNVIIQSVELLKAGNYDKIKDLVDKATKVGVNSDLGTDYIDDYVARTSETARETVSLPWDVINDLMDGGLGAGELAVVVAPSGVGKTWLLCAIGAAAVRAGKTVVHYSMELSESYVGRRYDTIFTSIPSSELADNRDVVRSKIGKLNGKLMIKYFPPKGVTSRKLEAHIEKMINSGNKPDLVIVDYADLMLSHSSKSDSTYAEQGGIYIDLRGMAGELKLPVWTASQTQRSAVDSEIIEGDKIADSYAKIMNADFVMSVSRRSKDKVSNTARFHIIKNRFGMDGITFPSKMDTHRGVIEVYEADSANGINATKQSEKGELLEKQTLHKKYVDTIGTANVDF
jgi:DnaB-like helicase C terminal domain